jgi:ribonuclease E
VELAAASADQSAVNADTQPATADSNNAEGAADISATVEPSTSETAFVDDAATQYPAPPAEPSAHVAGAEIVENADADTETSTPDESAIVELATTALDASEGAVNEPASHTHAGDTQESSVDESVATAKSSESLDSAIASGVVPEADGDHSERSDDAIITPTALEISAPALSTETALEESETIAANASGLDDNGRALNDPRLNPKPIDAVAVSTELTRMFDKPQLPPVSVVARHIPRASNDPRGPRPGESIPAGSSDTQTAMDDFFDGAAEG